MCVWYCAEEAQGADFDEQDSLEIESQNDEEDELLKYVRRCASVFRVCFVV